MEQTKSASKRSLNVPYLRNSPIQLANFTLKKDIYVNMLESVIFGIQVYIDRPEHKTKGGGGGGDPMELNFEGLEMHK